MSETFLENIGYIIAFLLFVLPRLLKVIFKASGTASTKKTGKRPPRQKTVKNVLPIPQKILEELALVEEEETTISEGELQELSSEAKALLGRAEDTWNNALIRSDKTARLATEIETAVVTPLRVMTANLDSLLKSGLLPDWTEGQRIRSDIDRKRRLIDLFKGMVEMRINPATEEILTRLDKVAKDCLEPYLDHSMRMRVSYSTRLAATLLGEPDEDAVALFEGERVAPVFVREKSAQIPRAWVNIASDIYLDVFYSTNGLQRKIISDLGVLPAPMSLNHYGDQRAFIAGLLGGWLPRIFADTCATLLLGPAFASGLSGWFGKEVNQSTVASARIGHATHRSMPLPLHVRMFVAIRVLRHLNFGDEAKSRLEKWNRQLDYPQTLTVEEAGGRKASLPIKPLLETVARVVDYLLTESNPTLGNFSLTEIPGLSCDRQRLARMEEVASLFLNGQMVSDPGYIVVGAAQLASEQSTTFEQRIVKASLGSLGDKVAGFEPASLAVKHNSDGNLYDNFKSRRFLARALVAGASLAPRTARFSRRG